MAQQTNRTTKPQFELLLNFLELNKDIVYQTKMHPLSEDTYNKKWAELAAELNASGEDEYQTSLSTIAGGVSTDRGWPKKVKSLLDYEERLLNLLNQTGIDGIDELKEASVPNAIAVLRSTVANNENILNDALNESLEKNVLDTELLIEVNQQEVATQNNTNCNQRSVTRKSRLSRLDKTFVKYQTLVKTQN
ncbi:hypothetical protein FQA39_LY13463 [Lamprigera yunnana]|nr:hypothetical protein FQA39_LY13463 [Lamprigera yunnana]